MYRKLTILNNYFLTYKLIFPVKQSLSKRLNTLNLNLIHLSYI